MRTKMILILCALLSLGAWTVTRADEFVGPFPSWANVKTDFGAVGDGKADDTAALQKGLLALGHRVPVLYLPPGTYRITGTLTVSGSGVMFGMLTGDDPATTIIKWDGAVNGTMLRGTGGFSHIKVARLTWDGAGRALAAVQHAWIVPPEGNICGTHNIHEDEIFKDVGFGIRAGEASEKGTGMDAETLVERCKFIRCWNAGLSVQIFNVYDWWLVNCEFDDCRLGATNRADGEYGGGHFHIYHSLFRNSTEADIKTGHASYFGIRFNTSIGSNAFLLVQRPNGVITYTKWAGTGSGGWSPTDKWGSEMLLQGNTILDPRQTAAIRVYEHGPLILLDNVVRSRREARVGPVVYMHVPTGKPELAAIGNTFTVEAPIDTDARLTALDNKTVAPEKIPDSTLKLPGAAAKMPRPIFEVPPDAGNDVIQGIIARALKQTGKGPVVHFPGDRDGKGGQYTLTQSLEIPANSDIQLVGDAEHTQLTLKGVPGQPLVHLAGPTKAVLRDLKMNNDTGPALLVTDCDQPGARVHGEMLDPVAKSGSGLQVEGVDNLHVELFGDMNYGSVISGGPQTAAGKPTAAHLGIFGGASSNFEQLYTVKNGARMVVWDTWYEGGTAQFIKMEGQVCCPYRAARSARRKTTRRDLQ